MRYPAAAKTAVTPVTTRTATETNATRWSQLSDLSNEAHDCTIVNGTLIYEEGHLTGDLPGTVLRGAAYRGARELVAA